MKFSAVLSLLCGLLLSGLLVTTTSLEAAPVKRKGRPVAAKKAALPKPSKTEVLSRELVESRYMDGAGLAGCTPKRFSYLASALNMNRDLLNSPQGEFEASETYAERRAQLAKVIGAESMVICEPLNDNPDVTFKYNPDRQTFEGSLTLDHNIYTDGKDLGSYRAKTAMGVAFNVSASVDVEYDLSLKIFGNPPACFSGSGYVRTISVPAPISSAPGIKSAGMIAYVVRLYSPYVEYDQSPGNPRIDHPYDRYVHSIKAYARLEKVLITDGSNQVVWACDVGVLGRSQSPKPVGDPGAWITIVDYPIEGYRLKLAGTVSAELAINENGDVSGCKVTTSSGSSALDDSTCAGWKKHATFVPATDESGMPVSGSFSVQKTWDQYGR